MISTSKSLSLTTVGKNNLTSRTQIAFRYVLDILQLVRSFSPLAYTRKAQRVICYLQKLVGEELILVTLSSA